MRFSRATAYFMLVVMGVAGLWLTPTTVVGTVGEPLVYWGSICAVAGGNLGFLSVLLRRDSFERLAAWPAVIGAGIYAASVWVIVIYEPSMTRTMQATAVTTLTLALLTRGLDLGGRAAKARVDHATDLAIDGLRDRRDG